MEYIRPRFRVDGLKAADGLKVSFNVHCSNPHYEPEAEDNCVIHAGDWVLINLRVRGGTQEIGYAAITWTAWVGNMFRSDTRGCSR